MLSRILGPVAATVLVAAAGVLGAPAGPAGAVPRTAAAAAACDTADGVTAVVDFNELGGGVTAACDPAGASKTASQVFPDVGYPLTYAQEGSGFVCRVSGKPADDPCVRTPPATAYWSLWWSDGKSEKWVYSTDGVGSLTVPDGGYVALSWHQGSGNASPPDVVPSAHETATPSPSGGGGSGGSGNGSGGSHTTPGTTQDSSSAAPSATTSASASESPTADGGHRRRYHEDAKPEKDDKPRHRRTDQESPTDSTTSALPEATELTSGPPADDDDADDGGSGFPTWVGVAIAVLVIGAAAAVPLLRRRAG